MSSSDVVVLRMVSGVVVDGVIAKAGSLVEFSDAEARDLLRRGKAVLADDADLPQEQEEQSEGEE